MGNNRIQVGVLTGNGKSTGIISAALELVVECPIQSN